MLDLKDAATFLRLCETSNLTRTASLCHVSPSTLSRTLNKLEEELKTKLCIRDKKGVVITEAGHKFERFARKTLNEYSDLESSLHTAPNAVTGTIRIFCSVTACYLFIPRLLNELHLVAPNLEIKIETGDPAESIFRLKSQQNLDFAISALPNEIPSDLNYVDLVTFPLILIAPKKPRFDGAGSDYSSFNLESVPFVMPEGGQLRYEVEKWFSSQGISPNIYSEIAGHEGILSLTALGFGVSVVPRLVYDISPFRNDVFILRELPWADFRVALCCLKKNKKDKRIRSVLELASRIAPSFEPDLSRRRADQLP